LVPRATRSWTSTTEGATRTVATPSLPICRAISRALIPEHWRHIGSQIIANIAAADPIFAKPIDGKAEKSIGAIGRTKAQVRKVISHHDLVTSLRSGDQDRW
jgi:hypothetical protein